VSANRIRLAEALRRTALRNLGRKRDEHVSAITGKLLEITPIPPSLPTNLRKIAATLTSPGQIDSLLYAADLLDERKKVDG
jgi:hypothetical protein